MGRRLGNGPPHYTAVSDSGDGQISITVKHSNRRGRALKDKTLTFTFTLTAGKSRVTFMRGSHAKGQIADGTKGYVVVRAPKRLTAAAIGGAAASSFAVTLSLELRPRSVPRRGRP